MRSSRDLLDAIAKNPTFNGTFGRGPRGNKPYFFIPNAPRHVRGIRHCKIYRHNNLDLLDYTVRGTQEFSTLEEWAHDCGSSTDSIRYGFESPDAQFPSMSLRQIDSFFFGKPFETQLHASLDKLATALNKMNLGFKSVFVAHGNTILDAQMIIDH